MQFDNNMTKTDGQTLSADSRFVFNNWSLNPSSSHVTYRSGERVRRKRQTERKKRKSDGFKEKAKRDR